MTAIYKCKGCGECRAYAGQSVYCLGCEEKRVLPPSALAQAEIEAFRIQRALLGDERHAEAMASVRRRAEKAEARVAEVEAEVSALEDETTRQRDRAKKAERRVEELEAVTSAPRPLTGAELAEKHGFEPVPHWKMDPFVRPMRIMVDGFAPNGQEPNNHAVEIESSSVPATPAKGCTDPASPAIGALPREEVTATAASKPGSGDGGERPAPISCVKCGQKDDRLDPDTGACYACFEGA
jgi:hypothetical protein